MKVGKKFNPNASAIPYLNWCRFILEMLLRQDITRDEAIAKYNEGRKAIGFPERVYAKKSS